MGGDLELTESLETGSSEAAPELQRRATDGAHGASASERRRALLILCVSAPFLLFAGYLLRDVVGPLVLALGLAYVLDPLVHWTRERLRCGRPLAVFVVFTVFLALAGGAVWFLVDQGIALFRAAFGDAGFLATLPERALAFLQELPTWVPGRDGLIEVLSGPSSDPAADQERLRATTRDLESALVAIGSALGTIFTVLSLAVLVPIYLYYFMLDLPRLYGWFRAHTPAAYQKRIYGLLHTIHAGLSAFLRGRVLIAVAKGLLTAVGLSIVGLPYAFVVGMAAGLLSILPFVGAGLGFVVALVLVLVSAMGASGLIGVVVVFVLAEAIEGYVLYPLILSDSLEMHPVTMLFSVLLWGTIFGVFGVLVAIPLTIVTRAIVRDTLLDPLAAMANGAPSD